ncbi:hypothetical protein ACFX13_008699 [Malus domestica]
MGSTEMQFWANIDGAIKECRLIFEVVVNGEVLGDKYQLRWKEFSFVVVVEGKLQLGEVVEQLCKRPCGRRWRSRCRTWKWVEPKASWGS